MNYNTPVNVAPVAVEEPQMPLYEQLRQLDMAVEEIRIQTGKLLRFVCSRDIEPIEHDGRSLSCNLAWMHNNIMRCIDALKDVNEVVQ